jgi:hypothetical protein
MTSGLCTLKNVELFLNKLKQYMFRVQVRGRDFHEISREIHVRRDTNCVIILNSLTLCVDRSTKNHMSEVFPVIS